MKTRADIDDDMDLLTNAAELRAQRAPWRIPVPPTHEHGLITALTVLQSACSETARRLVTPDGRQQFEDERVRRAYCRVEQELEWMLRGWALTVQLPEFAG